MATGRPRTFCVDQALDIALKVFWKKGYEGTSIDDLTKAMGINRPSLYCAFGNKEELFRKALDRYAEGSGALVREAIGEPTARAAAEHLLCGAADGLTDPRHPPGCLAVQGALSCGEAAEPIRKELCARRAAAEESLRERLRAGEVRRRPVSRGRPRRPGAIPRHGPARNGRAGGRWRQPR